MNILSLNHSHKSKFILFRNKNQAYNNLKKNWKSQKLFFNIWSDSLCIYCNYISRIHSWYRNLLGRLWNNTLGFLQLTRRACWNLITDCRCMSAMSYNNSYMFLNNWLRSQEKKKINCNGPNRLFDLYKYNYNLYPACCYHFGSNCVLRIKVRLCLYI